MDAVRFDALARALSRLGTRRGVLAAALGGAAALSGRDAAAICRKGGVDCTRDRRCCSERCLGNGTCSCRKASGKSVGCEPPEDPCRKATCSSTGRCVESPKTCGEGQGCDSTTGKCVPHCQDGVKDYDEEGVDCGGSCGPCKTLAKDGEACNDPGGGSCESGICQAQICRPKTCGNESVDAGETDLNCGGLCFPCAEGKTCEVHADCETGICCNAECLKCAAGEVCSVDAESRPVCCKPDGFCVTCQDRTGPTTDNCGRLVDCGLTGTAACAPPNTIAIPGSPACCSDGDCACDGRCCADGPAGDACFVDRDGQEFCCMAQGDNYRVCGNVCCGGPCDENGECPQQSGRLGSYRRGPIG